MCRTPTKQSNEPILGDEADTLVSAADTLIASTLVGGSPGRSSPLASLQPSPSHQNRSPGLQRLRSSYDLDAASQCGSEMTEGVIDLKITGSTSADLGILEVKSFAYRCFRWPEARSHNERHEALHDQRQVERN